MAADGQHSYFPTTNWSDIELLRQADGPAAQKVLDQMLEVYYPLFQAQLVRAFRVSEDQAADWLQSFVWKRVVVKNLFTSADRKLGKFRTFVINALLNFVRDEMARDKAHKRSPAGGFVHLEECREPAVEDAVAGSALDKAWGQAVLGAAIRQMRSECEKKVNQRVWEVFRLRWLEPAEEGAKPPAYKEFFARLGFRSDAEAGNAFITATRMFRRVLRAEVAKYCRTEEEIDQEIRELMVIFAGE